MNITANTTTIYVDKNSQIKRLFKNAYEIITEQSWNHAFHCMTLLKLHSILIFLIEKQSNSKCVYTAWPCNRFAREFDKKNVLKTINCMIQAAKYKKQYIETS